MIDLVIRGGTTSSTGTGAPHLTPRRIVANRSCRGRRWSLEGDESEAMGLTVVPGSVDITPIRWEGGQESGAWRVMDGTA